MEGVKGIFNQWELRILVILSIILQILLIFWTYQRKRISSRPIKRIAWLIVFLAADSFATLCLGFIFHVNMNTKPSESPQNKYLLAMWAPFMLLHLGRHSRITAFSLGENEFWLSHLIRFTYFELTALFISILAWRERRFHYTSTFLFIMGTIKYGERVLALKLGSLNGLRSFHTLMEEGDHLPNETNEEGDQSQNSVIDIPEAHKKGNLQVPFNLGIPSQRAVDEAWTVADAYKSFNKYKGIYTDTIFTYRARDEQDEAFGNMDITNAFQFMKTELSFAYDLFYTKSVWSDTLWGWIARLASLVSVCIALGIFCNVGKQGFLKTDVRITYFLLSIALILELVCLLESIVSNGTEVLVGKSIGKNWKNLERSIERIRNFVEDKARKLPAALQSTRTLNLGQFNLLKFCFNEQRLRPWLKWVLKSFEMKEFWDNYHYTTYSPIDDFRELKQCIVSRVKERLQEESAADNLYLAPISSTITSQMADKQKFQASTHTDLERCLLVWHLATDMCHRSLCQSCLLQFHELQNAKILSDYMLYLLVQRPALLSKLTTAELTSYQNLCEELIKFYARTGNDGLGVHRDLNHTYGIVIEGRPEVGSGTESLLKDGIELARELMEMWPTNNPENINIWELVFIVWVDMLSYVAYHSPGKQHAEMLGRGEELITYVRLFMVHCDGEIQVDVAEQS